MAKATAQRRPILGSTSLRLIVGFGVMFCVLSSALAINLYYMEKLRRASEELRVRQQIRRQTLRLGAAADRVYQSWSDAGVPDPDLSQQLDETYTKLAATLQALGSQHVDAAEWSYLNRLVESAGRLRDVLRKAHAVPSPADSEDARAELQALRQRGTTFLEDLTTFNNRIGNVFESHTYSLEEEAEKVWQFSLVVARLIIGIGLVAILLAVFFTHRSLMRPIRTLMEGTRRLAGGDLGSRLEVPQKGEFRELSESFNRMAQALEANQRQLIEAEKMATLGRFSAGIAHEINNPIAVILGYAKTMGRRLPPGSPDTEALRAIEEEARQCKNIVQQLLDVARPAREEAGEAVVPAEVVEEVMGLARVLQLTPTVRVRTDVTGRTVSLPFSRSRLRQVILNLASNALEAIQGVENATLTIEGYLRDGPEAAGRSVLRPEDAGRRFLILRFADNGPGIPAEHMTHLFEPFFTTKPAGTGLGLAVTYGIVNAHGGYVDVASTEGRGATFIVSVPLKAPGAPDADAGETPSPPPCQA